MYKGHTVGVVVPAYNEEGFVGRVIETIPDFVDRVYAIDDRSTDGTWEEIQEAANEANGTPRQAPIADGGQAFDQRVVPIRLERNSGVGAAIKTGYRRALGDGMDIIATMDGDGQMDPDYLDRLIDPIAEGKGDYAKGNRLLYREFRRGMSTWRFFGNSVLTLLTKIASGYWKMMDPQNGYRAISYHALERIGVDDVYEDYGMCNDILVRLNAHDFRIVDVAMPAVYGEERSSIKYSTFIPKVSMLLLRDFLWRLKVKYLVTDFHPLAMFYYLGALTALVGVAGIGHAVWSFAAGAAALVSGLLSFGIGVIGCALILLAMVFDMQANGDLEMQVYE